MHGAPFPTVWLVVIVIGAGFAAANVYGIIDRHRIATNNQRWGLWLRQVAHDELVESNVRINILMLVLVMIVNGIGTYMICKWIFHVARAWLS